MCIMSYCKYCLNNIKHPHSIIARRVSYFIGFIDSLKALIIKEEIGEEVKEEVIDDLETLKKRLIVRSQSV